MSEALGAYDPAELGSDSAASLKRDSATARGDVWQAPAIWPLERSGTRLTSKSRMAAFLRRTRAARLRTSGAESKTESAARSRLQIRQSSPSELVHPSGNWVGVPSIWPADTPHSLQIHRAAFSTVSSLPNAPPSGCSPLSSSNPGADRSVNGPGDERSWVLPRLIIVASHLPWILARRSHRYFGRLSPASVAP